MRILFDSLNQQSGLTLNEIFFLDKCFQLLLNDHAEHTWIFEPHGETKGLISLLPVGIKKSIRLKKIQPDVLITQADVNPGSFATNKKIIFFNQQFSLDKKAAATLVRCKLIVTTSQTLKQKLIERFQLNDSTINVIYAAPATDISLADWSEKLNIKDRYSDGRDFFLCYKNIGRSSGWEEVLKAFSIFKKWQQSSFQLLIATEIEAGFNEEFNERLASYKYRADVKILDKNKEDINRILPSAFGVVCSEPDHTGVSILNSFKAEVPVIASSDELFDEDIAGAFLPSINAADELSRQLINLYRDEQMRDILIEKGRAAVSRFSWEEAAQKWYASILKTAEV